MKRRGYYALSRSRKASGVTIFVYVNSCTFCQKPGNEERAEPWMVNTFLLRKGCVYDTLKGRYLTDPALDEQCTVCDDCQEAFVIKQMEYSKDRQFYNTRLKLPMLECYTSLPQVPTEVIDILVGYLNDILKAIELEDHSDSNESVSSNEG